MHEPRRKGKSHDNPKRLMWDAWLKVKENGGAAGVDGVTIEQFEEDLSGTSLSRTAQTRLARFAMIWCGWRGSVPISELSVLRLSRPRWRGRRPKQGWPLLRQREPSHQTCKPVEGARH